LENTKYQGTSRLTPGMILAMSTSAADFFITNRLIEYAAGTPSTIDRKVEQSPIQKLLKMYWR
jgi:hypothetical protein